MVSPGDGILDCVVGWKWQAYLRRQNLYFISCDSKVLDALKMDITRLFSSSCLATATASSLIESLGASTQQMMDSRFSWKKSSRSRESFGGPSKRVVGDAPRKLRMLQTMLTREGFSMALRADGCSPTNASINSVDIVLKPRDHISGRIHIHTRTSTRTSFNEKTRGRERGNLVGGGPWE